jgi:hypothetical protein
MSRYLFVLCWFALLVPIQAPAAAERPARPAAPDAAGALAARVADESRGPLAAPVDAATECPELDLPVPENSTWAWRLRAYRYLDCVTAIVDDALGTASANSAATSVERGKDAGGDTVSIPRAELDRIRNLAWWARDAAARIGN